MLFKLAGVPQPEQKIGPAFGLPLRIRCCTNAAANIEGKIRTALSKWNDTEIYQAIAISRTLIDPNRVEIA